MASVRYAATEYAEAHMFVAPLGPLAATSGPIPCRRAASTRARRRRLSCADMAYRSGPIRESARNSRLFGTRCKTFYEHRNR
jgi:hypothetical protein